MIECLTFQSLFDFDRIVPCSLHHERRVVYRLSGTSSAGPSSWRSRPYYHTVRLEMHKVTVYISVCVFVHAHVCVCVCVCV